MKIELRTRVLEGSGVKVQGAVLICQSEQESQVLDALFGNKLQDDDGLIARRQVEVRLADGFREHYLYVVPPGLEHK